MQHHLALQSTRSGRTLGHISSLLRLCFGLAKSNPPAAKPALSVEACSKWAGKQSATSARPQTCVRASGELCLWANFCQFLLAPNIQSISSRLSIHTLRANIGRPDDKQRRPHALGGQLARLGSSVAHWTARNGDESIKI